MKAYKTQILTLAVVGLVAVAISLTASAPSLSAAPSSNPPSGNVTPTFSGMDLQGPLENSATAGMFILPIDINDSVTISKQLILEAYSGWNLNVEGVNIMGNSGKLIIDGDLEVRGDLQVDQLGRIYSKTDTRTISNNTANNETVWCDSGDWILSCTGGFDADWSTTNAGVYGQEYTSSGAFQGCKVAVWNKSGGSRTMYAIANCIETDNNWGS